MFSQLIRIWDNHQQKKYSTVGSLVSVFFSRHHDDFGYTFEEIMTNYIDYRIGGAQTKIEVEALLQIDDEKLDNIMDKLSRGNFHPASLHLSWRNFLEKVQCSL